MTEWWTSKGNEGRQTATGPARSIARAARTIIAVVAGAAAGLYTTAKAADAGRSSPLVEQLLAFGDVVAVYPLFADDEPEGVALGQSGTVYLGNRIIRNGRRVSQVLELTGSGVARVFATLEAAGDPDAQGLLGLATDPEGNVYAAVVSLDPAVHGVWRIDRRGRQQERLPGSEVMTFPNALTFDARGDLYVTDSVAGAIWRFDGGASGSPWVQHVLLEPGASAIPLLPPIGANGIAFVPPRAVVVANTRQGSLVRVPIEADGSAGPPELLVQALALASVDGIAADVHGDIHAVVPGFALIPGAHPLVRVDQRTGEIARTPTDESAFHFPLSLAFATGAQQRKTVFVVNGGSLVPGVPGPGPGLVQAYVGVPGFTPR